MKRKNAQELLNLSAKMNYLDLFACKTFAVLFSHVHMPVEYNFKIPFLMHFL